MRFALLAFGVLFSLLLGNAYGQDKYLLQPGDSLEVWVAQEEDLRRNVIIEPDGWMSFPLAGHLQAAGLTVTEIEAALSEKLRPFFKENPNLTIMLRPDPLHQPNIFVAGEVMTPGSYPYRKGMTVLHGLSVAGGLYRREMLAADQDRSVVVRRTIDAADVKLRQLAVRQARIRAELDGSATIEVAHEDKGSDIVAQEQTLLDAHRQNAEAQAAARREVNELGTKNADAIRQQIDILDRRLEMSKQRRDATAALVERGALQATQKFEREGELAELESTRSQLQAELLTAQKTLQADLAVFDNAAQQRKEALLSNLVDLQREEQATRDSLADARKVQNIYNNAATAARESSQRNVVYRIVRSSNGEPREFEAAEMTPLQPGDLLRVVYASTRPPMSDAELSLQTPPSLPDTVDATNLTNAH